MAEQAEMAGADARAATAKQWALEARRRRMLAAMGIESLISRFDPPGAAPTRRLIKPSLAVSSEYETRADSRVQAERSGTEPASAQPPQPAQTPPEPARDSASASRPAAVPSTARNSSPTTHAAQASKSAERASGEATAAQPAVSFSLMVVQSPSWLWLEQLEDGLIQIEQLHLINAMASVIEGQRVQIQHRQFDWPMLDQAHLEQHAQAARQAVRGQLHRLQRESKPKGLIVLGEFSKTYLPDQTDLAMFVIPSSAQMLIEPLSKRDAWLGLKPLMSSDPTTRS